MYNHKDIFYKNQEATENLYHRVGSFLNHRLDVKNQTHGILKIFSNNLKINCMKHIRKMAPFAAMAVGAVLALATSAFNKASKSKSGDTMYTFQYNPPSGTDYSENSVKDVANWSYTTNNDRCNDNNVKACKIYVPEAYVDGLPTSHTLDESIDIVTGGTSTQAYVTSTDAGTTTDYFSNKLN